MASHSYPYPSTSYEYLQTFANDDEWPGPRCGHTLTAVFANDSHQLVLFGGSTTAVTTNDYSLPGISLEGVTNSVHSFDVLTRRWTRIHTDGDLPSPRACHAATSFGTLFIVQGGIGPSGLSDGDVYMLDLTRNDLKWHRLMGRGATPGPRYGHVMDIAAQRWLVIFGGKNGNEVLSDTWALDTQRPSAWDRLNPYGNHPSGRMYASATAREDGVFWLCGGRDSSGKPLGDTYALEMESIDQCGWTLVPDVAPSPRYQHTAVFEGPRMHVFGGVLNTDRLIDGEPIVAVLDTDSGEWLDVTPPETSASGSKRRDQYQLMQRCHHAAAWVGNCIYVHGGIKKDLLLASFLVAETSQPWSPEQEDNPENYMLLDDCLVPEISNPSSSEPEVPSIMRKSASESSPEIIAEPYNLPTVENAFYDSASEGHFLVDQKRTVNVESEQLVPQFIEPSSCHQDQLHQRIISTLLKPKDWTVPAEGTFFLNCSEVMTICNSVEQTFAQEPTLLQLKVPIKVFGDLHGQFGDLMRLFHEYGSPSLEGDITHIDYLFLGDYVDRGSHSLETIMLLLALKIEYPKNIHLIRGNHESSTTNRFYGFHDECKQKMGQADGLQAWYRINQLFHYLPLGAVIEDKILCVHGGIGRTLWLDEIASIRRPAFPDFGTIVLKDTLWSDPTANDSVMGIQSNARGEAVVTFGPDIVNGFCERNKIQMIIRGHECVSDGFERFAEGRLITVFSATNYCGSANNAGAILVIGRDLVIYPKLIQPRPPSISSSENCPEKEWMEELNEEMPPTPPRGETAA
ncbi:PREDICTED: serine/threonine-protein phosphatase BSU1-like [Camelina sativa]|uniref:Serine/threonine-protein phosphatase n=1 Tax=Camelina sativa TaxID=90675 RepID=A0ABM0VJY3_CAMSA|nr:PREDICTED: serine/threonine-protein phosphatase BSU1-like [Camelina sativa]